MSCTRPYSAGNTILSRQNSALSHVILNAQNRSPGRWGANRYLQERDSLMENTVRPRHQTGQAERSLVEEMAAFKKSAMASDAAARSCTEEQLADPMKCRQCITALKKAGRHDEARAEPFLFNTAHPESEPPASPSEVFRITMGR